MANYNKLVLGKSLLSGVMLRVCYCDGFAKGVQRSGLMGLRSQRTVYFSNNFGTQCVQQRISLLKTLKFRRYKSTQPTKRPDVKRSELKRLLSFAVSEKYKLLGATALLTVSSATALVLPFGIGRIIDLIYTQSKEGNVLNSLGQLCVILLGIFVVGALANFGRVYLMNVAGSRIINELRKKLFRSVSQQEMAFFDKTRTGELVNRLAADTGIIGQSVTTNISDGLRSLFQAIGGISLMVYMSPKLALISLGIVPPLFFLLRILGGYMRRLTTKVQDAWAASTQVAEEKLGNIRTVRAFAQEDKENAAFGSKVDDIQRLAYKEATARGIYWGSTQLAGNMMVLSVFYYGGKLMNEAQISVGDLTSFLLYAAFVGVSLSSLTSFYAELMRGLGASMRIFELLDKRPEIPTAGGLVPVQPVQGLVELSGISFSYPSRPDMSVLKDFTLTVPSGSVMAIVGASGSGKSTITSLLLRYYDPLAGHIKVDGHDITTVDPRWLRHNIGVVNQEPALFSCSIAENISYGAIDPAGVSMADVVAAAKMANAHEFIERFPDKYNTIVGERGIMLSGGQKQRVAIARAIIKNPKILLLDEATSALDAESEYLVQEALERAVVNRTVITIAHRLSTIKNASCIAVLDGGRVVELGKYDELRQRPNGVFRRLVDRQAISITKS